ncbi:helix-turn-helix domain-containing protein [Haloplasma contractile]|uniref:Adenine deaminase protein n=1 Tax=Haloplasma contractile SSD-17B TaxID=1033810 RepID=U2FS13_9MOLU|nr:XRE family transcriptional regulator [Haloplasma contractile]ERJ13754.1 adenine deaminase protein [Haloplasma contractile SSD-17B]
MEIGIKIKRLRTENGLTQEELADRCEITKGFVSQIERDMTSPSIATLVDILEALGTNLSDFFGDETDEKIVFSEEDMFVKEEQDYNMVINWIVPNAQKNEMEPIIVDLKPGGHTYMDSSHKGEEFGYVLEGELELKLGRRTYKVKKGESFYYTSNKEHHIRNKTKEHAKFLWVSTPPTF